jgi:hypothetical protein
MVAAAYARQARWDMAAETLANLVEKNPDDHWNWCLAACVTARSGNTDRYRRLCRLMLDRYRETSDPDIAERISKSCSLLPHIGAEQQQASRLAERAVAIAHAGVKPWTLAAKGLADYRRERFADALADIQESRTSLGRSGQWNFEVPVRCVRAMALLRLGRRDVARADLESASTLWRSSAPQTMAVDPGQYWTDLLICEILHREAEAVILYDPVFPADPFAR